MKHDRVHLLFRQAIPVFCALAVFCSASGGAIRAGDPLFPRELVRFSPIQKNPVFRARGKGHWDVKHRERGWILRDGKTWHLWFTGYDGTGKGQKMLGYATSKDGIHWVRHAKNPVYRDHWVEDMMVVKQDGTFYMFAEGKNDICQLLTSPDGVRWKRIGPLDIRRTNGKPISAGPRGTPTAFHENGVWHLFYERYDKGVWLATSTDMKVWRNVSDEPVLKLGPGPSDRLMIALNQIIKYKGRYYAYYHGSGTPTKPRFWTTNIAVSSDLRHWKKYPGNPLLPTKANKSSGIVIHDGKRFRLYTMHDEVHLHLPVKRAAGASKQTNWPQFRGPHGTGIAAGDAALPAEIGPDRNLLWKRPIGKGHSSPVLFGKRMYLTAFQNGKLLTLALDVDTGKTVWSHESKFQKLESVHRIGSPATSSVCTDG
ncbi:MAG: hypothetical protein IID45_02995, partial [Planctomycetes bacterium]|nr:hypothetical protein [Planctomycetota bacterium]